MGIGERIGGLQVPDPEDFHYNINWNDTDRCYHARCIEIPCCSGQGHTIKEAERSIYLAVTDHLEYRAELNLAIPLPR
jgi:predicted RNase H-like HicB family nuclease